VGRAGYYAWLKRRDSVATREKRTKDMIRAEFDRSRGTYGVLRILEAIRRTGERIGRRKCASYMSEPGLDSCHNRHRSKSLTNSGKARGERYANILRDKEFPVAPGMGLTSDITYLRTGQGFMYHCVIKDIVTKEVLGDHMGERMTKEPVLNAILSVTAKHELAIGCIFIVTEEVNIRRKR
jgi:putative transposase